MLKRDWSDLLNPILVKESRQFFHNNLIVMVTWLFLAAQLAAMIYGMYQKQQGSESYADQMAEFMVIVLLFGSYLICCFGSMIRYSSERSRPELDCSRITPLSPLKILCGKISSNLVVLIYFHAMFLPFFLIASFLGVSGIWEMFGTAAFIFSFVLFLSITGLFFGGFGNYLMLGMYILVCIGVPALIYWFVDDTYLGISSTSLNGILLFLLLSGIPFTLAYAMLKSVNSNPMRSARVYLTFFFFVFPLIFLNCWDRKLSASLSSFPDFIRITHLLGALLVIIILSMATILEYNYTSSRFKRPAWSPLKCLVMYPFSTGWGGGIALCWLLLGVILLENLWAWKFTVGTATASAEAFVMTALALYALFCTQLSIWMARFFKCFSAWIYGLGIVFVTGVLLPLVLREILSNIGISDMFLGTNEFIKFICYLALGLVGFSSFLIFSPLVNDFEEFCRQKTEDTV